MDDAYLDGVRANLAHTVEPLAQAIDEAITKIQKIIEKNLPDLEQWLASVGKAFAPTSVG